MNIRNVKLNILLIDNKKIKQPEKQHRLDFCHLVNTIELHSFN